MSWFCFQYRSIRGRTETHPIPGAQGETFPRIPAFNYQGPKSVNSVFWQQMLQNFWIICESSSVFIWCEPAGKSNTHTFANLRHFCQAGSIAPSNDVTNQCSPVPSACAAGNGRVCGESMIAAKKMQKSASDIYRPSCNSYFCCAKCRPWLKSGWPQPCSNPSRLLPFRECILSTSIVNISANSKRPQGAKSPKRNYKTWILKLWVSTEHAVYCSDMCARLVHGLESIVSLGVCFPSCWRVQQTDAILQLD